MTEFTTHEADRLSPAGEARRVAMRGMLLHEVGRRRARRHALRGGAGVGAAAVVALGAWVAVSFSRPTPGPHHTPTPIIVKSHDRTTDAPAPAPRLVFEVVATRVSPADPRIVRTPPRSASTIDDDELLMLLAAAGHPTGLIRTGGSVTLTAAIPPLPAADPG